MVILPEATSSTKLIVCAAKLPVPSRLTRVFGVLRFVPVTPTALSTYDFVATSVAFVVVPAIVIIFVVKFPDASRETIVLAVFALVAVVAELETFPAVVMVANLVSTIAAEGETSASIIKELDRSPDASLCTTPTVVNESIATVPPADIFILSKPLVLNDKVPALADNPVVVLPVNTNDGAAVVPAGNCKVPVIVSPERETLLLSCG